MTSGHGQTAGKIPWVMLTDTFLNVHLKKLKNVILGTSTVSNKFETCPWCNDAALAGDKNNSKSHFRDALKLIQSWNPSSASPSSLTRFLHLLSDLHPTLGAQQRSWILSVPLSKKAVNFFNAYTTP